MKLSKLSERSLQLREKVVRIDEQKVFLSRFFGSEQEKDLTKKPNCNGFGRIHHFYRKSNPDWIENPLPMDPAFEKLGCEKVDPLQVQVFQIGACNFDCWYCFVDDSLRSANIKFGSFLSTKEIIDLYQKEAHYPKVIDLSGGNPGLVPEWSLWMIKEILLQGLENDIYIWEDDNLSNDYLWRFINEQDLELLANYRNYGRVGCFKGFDEESFSFNTTAPPEYFAFQFEKMKRIIEYGLDVYAYVTFTTTNVKNINDKINRFLDRLQEIDLYLPLRTIPLEIKIFKPFESRALPFKPNLLSQIIENQIAVCEAWKKEFSDRFTIDELSQPITNVKIGMTS